MRPQFAVPATLSSAPVTDFDVSPRGAPVTTDFAVEADGSTLAADAAPSSVLPISTVADDKGQGDNAVFAANASGEGVAQPEVGPMVTDAGGAGTMSGGLSACPTPSPPSAEAEVIPNADAEEDGMGSSEPIEDGVARADVAQASTSPVHTAPTFSMDDDDDVDDDDAGAFGGFNAGVGAITAPTDALARDDDDDFGSFANSQDPSALGAAVTKVHYAEPHTPFQLLTMELGACA